MMQPNNAIERAALREARKIANLKRYQRRYRRIQRRRVEDKFRHFLRSKPRSVRRLAAEFPIGERFYIDGKIHYLYGYNESDMLLLSEYNPAKSVGYYELGCLNIKRVCASHFRRSE